jgi:BirA family biotin operon repressor/biotin-[acetyl-CoA-carboxylase] ligase
LIVPREDLPVTGTASDALPAELAQALDAVRDRLPPLAARVLYFHTAASTNDVALELAARGGADGAVVIADGQTAGRGRRGHRWFSPPGSGLYVSMVLRPSTAAVDPQRATGLLTLAAGLALSEALETATGLGAAIKWPNDLFVGGRKLAGILAESTTSDLGRVVLGYGVNVSTNAYPPELGDRATSVEAELGRPVDKAMLCAETIVAVSRRYRDLLAGRFDAILDGWRRRAPASRDARVSWRSPSGLQDGVTAGIDDRGALLIRISDRVETIVGGEVTWLP